MIMSLGGSPEPLKKSIENHKPARIVFLASHDSISLSGEILKDLSPRPAVENEITENPNVMFECYKAARRCVDRVKAAGATPGDVVVDYTGGTKVMTAALILATIGHPFQFSYVGGDARSKNGLGTVMDGHEKLYPEMSPWSVFAEEERKQVVVLFNRRRFSAVREVIDGCVHELPFEVKSYFGFVRPLAEGFLFWEQFNHKAARDRMNAGLEALKANMKMRPDPALEAFSADVRKLSDFLQRLLEATENHKRMHPILVEDLVNNAHRRMLDQRYDDAAARAYRALELYGQICFHEAACFANDSVDPGIVPEKIREEFVRKYQDPRTLKLKLPLAATFQYLNAIGHEAGVRFFERQEKLRNIQINRNQSILAHGIRPVSGHAMASIFETVADFVGVRPSFDFPLLP